MSFQKMISNIDYSLFYLQENKHDYDDLNNSFIVSRLALSLSVTRSSVDIYGLRFLHKFLPESKICEQLLNHYPDNDDILVCCVKMHYNDLYFQYCSSVFIYTLYKAAANTNNKAVFDHQVSLCDYPSFLDLTLGFNYLEFLPHDPQDLP